MNSIELTKEQKSKLLEMCNELFPEYPNLEVRDSMEDFCMEQEHCFIELNEVTDRRKCTIIHWFEFCITHLSKKIFKFNFPKTHNIDFLYDNFLKNKIKESKPKIIYELIKIFPGSPKIGYKFDFTHSYECKFTYRDKKGNLMDGVLSHSDILEMENWQEFFKKLKL